MFSASAFGFGQKTITTPLIISDITKTTSNNDLKAAANFLHLHDLISDGTETRDYGRGFPFPLAMWVSKDRTVKNLLD